MQMTSSIIYRRESAFVRELKSRYIKCPHKYIHTYIHTLCNLTFTMRITVAEMESSQSELAFLRGSIRPVQREDTGSLGSTGCCRSVGETSSDRTPSSSITRISHSSLTTSPSLTMDR